MDRLPVEMLVKIFSLLEPQDLHNVSHVSKAWRSSCAESTWKSHFRHKFGPSDTDIFTPLLKTDFSWQGEVISRYSALSKWQKRRLPGISYKAPCGPVDGSAVHWDFKMLFAMSHHTGRHSITHLNTGSFHRRSKRAQLGPDFGELPSAVAATKFGILSGYHNGGIIFTSMGEESIVVHTHDAKIDALWLSDVSIPSRTKEITMAAASGNRILFFAECKPIVTVSLDYSSAPEAEEGAVDIVRSIHSSNGEFWILAEKSVYKVGSDFTGEHFLDTTAKDMHVSYPYMLLIGDTLTRVDIESGQSHIYCSERPTAYKFDENVVVVYTESDQMLAAWPIKGRFPEPLWSTYVDSMIITSLGLNAVVVVCGGGVHHLMVLDVLSGKQLPVKPMKNPGRKQWEVPGQDYVSHIHVSPALDDAMIVLVMGQTIMVYGIGEDTQDKKPKTPGRKRDHGVDVEVEDVESYHDYHVRRINRENLERMSNTQEHQEQFETAIALSESTERELTEEDQMKIAIANSMADSVENMSEEEQMRLAIEMSMSADQAETISDEYMESDEELKRVLEASRMDQ